MMSTDKIVADNRLVEEEEDEEEGENAADEEMKMENDEGTAVKKNPFKEKIMGILQKIECSDKRARKLDITDFLKILNEFNENNIHFV